MDIYLHLFAHMGLQLVRIFAFKEIRNTVCYGLTTPEEGHQKQESSKSNAGGGRKQRQGTTKKRWTDGVKDGLEWMRHNTRWLLPKVEDWCWHAAFGFSDLWKEAGWQGVPTCYDQQAYLLALNLWPIAVFAGTWWQKWISRFLKKSSAQRVKIAWPEPEEAPSTWTKTSDIMLHSTRHSSKHIEVLCSKTTKNYTVQKFIIRVKLPIEIRSSFSRMTRPARVNEHDIK